MISHIRFASKLFAVALAVGGLVGCSSSPTTSGSTEVSFSKDVVPILQTSCSAGGNLCHGDPSVVTMGAQSDVANRDYLGPPTGTYSTAVLDQVYTAMINKPSFEDPSMNVVTPGDPTKSFLMYKMDGNLSGLAAQCMTGELMTCGTAMPYPGVTVLPLTQRDTVRQWISEGAKNN